MSGERQVLEQAAHWFAVLQDEAVGEAERRAWQRWVSEPAHAQAWARVEAISGRVLALAVDPASRRAGRLLQQPDRGRRQALKLLSLAACGGLLGLAGTRAPWPQWFAGQSTAVGEVRELALADGSRLWLNTRSAADIAFDARVRMVRLHQGEVLLETAGDPRPFVLRSPAGLVSAGQPARFALTLAGARSQLNVYAGEVRLQAGRRMQQRLAAGQGLAFDATGIGALRAADSGRQAWSRGVLLADDLPLARFAAELARYRRGHLGCDPRVAGMRVVGAFPLDDPERVLDALAATLPVRIERRLPWWVEIRPA